MLAKITKNRIFKYLCQNKQFSSCGMGERVLRQIEQVMGIEPTSCFVIHNHQVRYSLGRRCVRDCEMMWSVVCSVTTFTIPIVKTSNDF